MALNNVNKPTIVLGASENPERYSNKACLMLQKHNHSVFPIGIKEGKIGNSVISTSRTPLQNIDTITLYIGPKNQAEWLDFIIQCKPKRVVFNPGTENEIMQKQIASQGIEVVEACTLVMLSIGNY